jgi:hypothetical protein
VATQRGRTVIFSSPLMSVTPSACIAARCGPRAMKVTSTSPFCASRAPSSPPIAPAP